MKFGIFNTQIKVGTTDSAIKLAHHNFTFIFEFKDSTIFRITIMNKTAIANELVKNVTGNKNLTRL
ncbi:hypothetical protein LSA03_01920 [Pediococcus argentinicus]|nr:hypothetical protein LSA03_01920 [Pediococcus argentinicus]